MGKYNWKIGEGGENWDKIWHVTIFGEYFQKFISEINKLLKTEPQHNNTNKLV